MMIIGERRNHEIEKLALPNNLKKLTRGEYVHPDLEFRCNEIFYSAQEEDFSPENFDVVPLWESDSSITAFYTDADGPVFVFYYVEEINSYKVIGRTVSDLVDFLVENYAEYENEAELKALLLS
jgi:hypothetical protein